MKSFIAIIAAYGIANVAAMPTFPTLVPNGANVAGVAAIGHVDVAGGGPRNEFGMAFEKAGTKWTKELCQADSDGDGQTNGQELGDPCCEWTKGKTPLLPTASAPGDPNSMADATTWASVKCKGTGAGAGAGANPFAGGVSNATADGSLDEVDAVEVEDDKDSHVHSHANATAAPASAKPAQANSATATTVSAIALIVAVFTALS